MQAASPGQAPMSGPAQQAGATELQAEHTSTVPRGTALGIDIGTANLRVGVWKPDEQQNGEHVVPVMDRDANGTLTELIPALVGIDDTGRLLVGHDAIRAGLFKDKPERCITNVTRLLGRPWSHLEIQRERRSECVSSFRSVARHGLPPFVQIHSVTACPFFPVEMSGNIQT